MQASVDNIWTSRSTLHFRVCVWYGKHNGLKKFECHVPLDELDAVDARHIVSALGSELFPLDLETPLPGL